MKSWIILFGIILGVQGRSFGYEVEVFQETGDPANRVDLLILGDGYREEDQPLLTQNADEFLSLLWSHEAFGRYRQYFNVKLVYVVSKENGADYGSYGDLRDTVLGSYYGNHGASRGLYVDNALVFDTARTHAAEYDFIFVLVNDPKFGGSGGSIAVSSNDPYMAEKSVHELGHSFGELADEYDMEFPGFPPCEADCPEPNVTTQSNRELVKWNAWIDSTTPVPTPETGTYDDQIGVFEGARYQPSGLFRPKMDCLMNHYQQPFDSVCTEALIKAVYQRVSPIDETLPPLVLEIGLCENATLQIRTPGVDPDSFEFVWDIDGQVQEADTREFVVNAWALGDGEREHVVTVTVRDATELVRNDPDGLCADSASWQIRVNATQPYDFCLIEGACIPAGTKNPLDPEQVCLPLRDPKNWSPAESSFFTGCVHGQWPMDSIDPWCWILMLALVALGRKPCNG